MLENFRYVLTSALIVVLTPATYAAAGDFQTLYKFSGGADGGGPVAAVTVGPSGTLYGTTLNGGVPSGFHDSGVAFELKQPAQRQRVWNETVLYTFSATNDGYGPESPLLIDASGSLYGTTFRGGTGGAGTIFKLTSDGAAWQEQILIALDGENGSLPLGNLLMDGSGALIGIMNVGAGRIVGEAYRLVPPAEGETDWQISEMHAFKGYSRTPTDGIAPYSGLLSTPEGSYSGTTNEGGAHGDGLVYRLLPSATSPTGWHESELYSFAGGHDGARPKAQLIEDREHNLYGTTTLGGVTTCNRGKGCGTVFELSPQHDGTGGWTETILYRFAGGSGDGAHPLAGLYRDRSGALYGTTLTGGIGSCRDGFGCGTVFKLTPPAAGQTAWTETVLHLFDGRDGAEPVALLVRGPGGWLYGTTQGQGVNSGDPHHNGTVFRIRP
jgi:uncharacterized repeat protein (TIGR03803 family)